jgi:hypothetical protein
MPKKIVAHVTSEHDIVRKQCYAPQESVLSIPLRVLTPKNAYHNEWLTILEKGNEVIPTFMQRPDKVICWHERRNIGNRTSAVHKDCTDTENAGCRMKMNQREGTKMMVIS